MTTLFLLHFLHQRSQSFLPPLCPLHSKSVPLQYKHEHLYSPDVSLHFLPHPQRGNKANASSGKAIHIFFRTFVLSFQDGF